MCTRKMILCWMLCGCLAVADGAQESAETPVQATQHTQRYLQILRRRPSFGTALERVCTAHLEQGTLDQLVTDLSAADRPPVDHLLAGMLELQRGRGAAVVALLEPVEQQRPQDAVASQALARALTAAGDIGSAIAAWERAIERGPARTELRTIYRRLAQLHRRQGHPDRALAVWQQLEAAWPRDVQIREDVAARLQQDGQLPAALTRWQQLAAETDSPQQRSHYRLSIAEIQLRQQQTEAAIRTLEDERRSVRPGSWLDQVIRERLEHALRSDGGRQSVIAYYRRLTSDSLADQAAVERLAELLTTAGSLTEAADLLRKSVALHPSSLQLRVTYMELLVRQQKLIRAIDAGRQLLQLNDAGPDERQRVGQLMLQQTHLSRQEREDQASEIWMTIAGDQTDAVRVGQVARLHARSGLTDVAVQLYGRAIQLQPENTVWREECGRTLYAAGDTQQAFQAWAEIATGDRRSTDSLRAVSQILESVHETDRAIRSMQAACTLRPGLNDRLRLADLLRERGRLSECYRQLDEAEKLAQRPGEHRQVLSVRQQVWRQDPALNEYAEQLRERLARKTDSKDTTSDRLQLAWVHEIRRDTAEAVRQIEQVVETAPDFVSGWEAAAEFYLSAGLLERASMATQRLADLDRAGRRGALQRVVQLQLQLGQRNQALATAEVLVQENPAHAPTCRLYAELCFEAGRHTDGLARLQQCVRLNPGDTELTGDVAELLASLFQLDEAADLLWRGFRHHEQLEQRVALVEQLVRLAHLSGNVDSVIEQLTATTSLDPVDRTVCVATALWADERPEEARQRLEQELSRSGHDLRLLRMLVNLAEHNHDFAAAAEWQKQVTALAETETEKSRLADLQYRSGQLSESELSWIRDARSGEDTDAALRSVDRFLEAGRVEAAELICGKLAVDRPNDWRVLYRLGMIQRKLDRIEESSESFHRLLALPLADNHVLVAAEQSGHTTTIDQRSGGPPPAISPVAQRVDQVRRSLNWLQLYVGNELWSQRLLAPADYGGARCAAQALLWQAETEEQRTRHVAELKDAAEHGAVRALTECVSIVLLRNSARGSTEVTDASLDILWRNIAPDSPETRLLLLGLWTGRGAFSGLPQRRTDAELERRLLTAAVQLAWEQPEWLEDIGGWNAICHGVSLSGRDALMRTGLPRLLTSPRPHTLVQAARLADELQAGELWGRALQLLTEQHFEAAGIPHTLRTLVSAAWEQRQENNELLETAKLHDTLDQLLAVETAFLRPLASEPVPQYQWIAQFAATAGSADTSQAEHQTGSRDSQRQKSRVRTQGGSAWQRLSVLAELLSENPATEAPPTSSVETLSYLRQKAADHRNRQWIPAALALVGRAPLNQLPENDRLLLIPLIQALPQERVPAWLLVHYLKNNGATTDALALLERMPVSRSRDELAETELLRMQLCVELERHEGARTAAQRLSGISLSAEQSTRAVELMQLAGLEEGIRLFRPDDAAENRSQQLWKIMLQYRDQGNPDAAARIARQFLLQPEVTLQGSSVVSAHQMRQEALQLLASTQNLDPLIRQLKRRALRQPPSVRQQHTLIELLAAAGQTQEADRLAEHLRQSLVDDFDAAIGLARQLERQGQLDAACTVCGYLLAADSQLFHRDYYRFIRLFEGNRRLPELANLLLTSNWQPTQAGHWGIQQLTERLLADPDTTDIGLQLFQRAWQAWPDSRRPLMANVSHPAIWSLLAVSEYATSQLFPAANRSVDPWSGLVNHVTIAGHGRLQGTLSRILQAPRIHGQLPQLRKRVKQALELQPTWLGGRIYLVVIDAHLQAASENDTAVQELIDAPDEPMPAMVAWALASELHHTGRPELRSTVLSLLDVVTRRQQQGLVLLKSDSPWHAAPDYLLLETYLAPPTDTRAVPLVHNLIGQLVQGSDAPDAEQALRGLADRIEHQLPDQSRQIRQTVLPELRATAPQPPGTHSPLPLTERDSKLIRQLRRELLSPTSLPE